MGKRLLTNEDSPSLQSKRERFAMWLRKMADRIGPNGAPRITNYSFTYEKGEGIRFRDDGRGCTVVYYGHDEYARSHTEADNTIWPEMSTGE